MDHFKKSSWAGGSLQITMGLAIPQVRDTSKSEIPKVAHSLRFVMRLLCVSMSCLRSISGICSDAEVE